VKLLLFAFFLLQQNEPTPVTPKPPAQPVPYSHKTHVGLGLQCKNCHTNPDPGELMGIPETKVCMGCHSSIKTDSPHIEKLTNFHKQQKQLPWARVYSIPGYVFFSHRAHMEAGAKCENCHGQVAQRDALYREGNVTMGACMKCHEQTKASNDCGFCHEPR
jgi:Zn ribbon nucleic-acid-binding protein